MSVPLKERHPNVGLPAPTLEAAPKPDNEIKQLKLYRYSKTDEKVPVEFVRGVMLGKGAFAVCYELTQASTSQIYAGKITAKAKLKTENARRKLLMEVRLHKELRHQHIVTVHNLYEDEENYYMLMEKCNGKTLRDMVRRHKRLEENEAKRYMLQLLDAVEYLQKHNIAHRDMKLDNIFMHNDSVKLGDFGLAAKLGPNEKKMTMCGTPNYIAPEVLARTGHGVEVDNWAVGVILYALLVGTPPFETKAVESTYEKIKTNDYSFPEEFPISYDAQDLIGKILQPDPIKRLSIGQIRAHRFFALCAPLRLLDIPLARSSQNSGTPEQATEKLATLIDAATASDGVMTRARRRESLLREAEDAAPAPTSPNGQNKKRKRVDDDMPEGEKRPATDEKVKSLQSEPRFNSQIIQSPSKRVRDQYKTMSSRTANEPRMIAELHDHIEKFIAQLNGEKTSPCRKRSTRSQSVSPSLRKHVWIVKWVDYSQKYGLGYQFCDGTIGVSFNDASKMVLSENGSTVEFHKIVAPETQSSGSSTVSVREQKVSKTEIPITTTLVQAVESCTDQFTKKRLALLNYFKEYLNKSSKSPGLDAKPLMLDACKEDEANEQTSILHWIRTDDGIVFLMSDFSAQVNFFDHCKIVVDRNLESITHVSAEGQRTVMTPAQALSASIPDLSKRLKYLATCISSFWMERNSETQLVI